VTTPVRYALNEMVAPYIPRDDDLTRLAAERLITPAEHYPNMRRQGYSEAWSTKLLSAAWRVPAYAELREMVWRNAIGLDDLRGALRVMGVREDFVTAYEKLIERIPGPADLIRFVVREVILPEKFYDLMELQGFTREVSEWFWGAHWVLPPLTLCYEAVHRGLRDLEWLKRMLILHDYEAKYHDMLIGTAYRLIPRVDLRYAYEMGIPGFEDLTPYFLKLGYSPEDAEHEARIQVRRALTAEIGRLVTNVKADLAKGYITEEQARADLEALRIHPDVLEFHIADALEDKERRHKDERTRILVTAYMKDIISFAELERGLSEFIVDVTVLTDVLDRARMRKEKVTEFVWYVPA